MNIIETTNYDKMSNKTANIISAQIILCPDSILGLATGSTPCGIYHQLVDNYRKGNIDFKQVTSVNLDEYCGLAPNDSQSYRYYMNKNLFNHINIHPERTFIPNCIISFIPIVRAYFGTLSILLKKRELAVIVFCVKATQ